MAQWYIRDIIIYGKNSGQARRISFEPGVNIITGDSKTGKSALLSIIDYCLGAPRYEVPVGVIRDFASWYAIRLQINGEQVFIARREPGGRQVSSAMHLISANVVDIPETGEGLGNSDRDTVMAELSIRLRLFQQSIAQNLFDSVYTEPPSLRSIVPFLLQPQNIIANKDALFYGTFGNSEGVRERRERLQRVLPYFLGITDEIYFVLVSELEQQRRALRQAERILQEHQALSGGSSDIARTLRDRAVALGLLDTANLRSSQDPVSIDNGDEVLVLRQALSELVERQDTLNVRVPAAAMDSSSRINEQDRESRTIRRHLAALRNQLSSAEELLYEQTRYGHALAIQGDRLRAVDLIPGHSEDARNCPICGQSLTDILPSSGQLYELRAEISERLQSLTAAQPAMAPVMAEIREEIIQYQQRLVSVESELAELRRVQNSSDSADAAWAEQQRHLGAIRFYLERTEEEPGHITDLRRSVVQMRTRLSELERQIAEYDVQDRRDSVQVEVSRLMSDVAQRLPVEVSDALLRLDMRRLTLIRSSAGGRPERLNEIGSGENWVSYHLCALLALHRFFMDNDRPVPSILILDQPSQVYFPPVGTAPSRAATRDGRRRAPGGERRARGTQPPQAGTQTNQGRTTDWEAVRQIYKAIFDVVDGMQKRLQVIILDHADFQSDFLEFKAAIRAEWRGHGLI